MPQVKITVDGTETTHEVEAEAITFDDGQRLYSEEELSSEYVPRSQVEGDTAQYVLKASMQRRYKNWINKSKAHEDESVIAKVLAEHGDAFKAENLVEAKQQWAEAELRPALEAKDQAVADRAEIIEKVVARAIDAAAAQVWDAKYAAPPEPGRPSWIQSTFAKDFAYDAEHGYVAALKPGTDEFLSATNPTVTRPYMGVEERMRQFAAQDAWRPYARAPERITTDPAGKPGPATSKDGKPLRRSEMSVKEKTAYVEEHGQPAFQKLPW